MGKEREREGLDRKLEKDKGNNRKRIDSPNVLDSDESDPPLVLIICRFLIFYSMI